MEVRLHRARTRDGWTLALHRYRLPSSPSPWRLPVLLCHGMGSNRHSFDVPQGPSLARFLAERGWDVWCPELRGCGHSTRPRLFNGRRWEWTFRHHATLDAPAALERVCAETGASGVHWIGHSLGGMLAYALLVDGRAPLQSAATLAAPALQLSPRPGLPGAGLLQSLLSPLPFVPMGTTARLGAPLTRLSYRLSPWSLLYNPNNMDPATIRRMLSCALDDIPARLLVEYLSAGRERPDREASETFAHELRLGEIRTPLLLIGGVRDRLCPPGNLKALHDQVASPVKRLLLLGRETGCQHDYAHHDLLLGKNVHTEVFPLLERWLAERDAV